MYKYAFLLFTYNGTGVYNKHINYKEVIVMKRKNYIIAVLTLLLALFPVVNAVAKSNQPKIKENKQITDLNELYNRAVKGVSDKQEKHAEKWIFKNHTTNEIVEVDALSTTQILKSVITNDYEEITYATTTFLAPEDTVNFTDGLISNDSTMSEVVALSEPYGEANKWDSTYGVKAYSTKVYTVITYAGKEAVKMSRVYGGWYVADTTIRLEMRHVWYGQNGTSAYDGSYVNDQVRNYYPAYDTWDYSVDSGWTPIKRDASMSVGVNSEVNLVRGSSVWSLYLQNWIR